MTSRDGIPELPTIDLDSPGDDARYPTEYERGNGGRSAGRIIAGGLALALAFVLGVVVHDARTTASAEQQVEFVAGSPYRGGLGNPQGRREIRVNVPVINTGTAPGQIVGLRIRGFEVTDEIDIGAEPGRWSTIRTSVIPECDVRAGRELQLAVETPGGQQTVVTTFQAADRGMTTIWAERCDPSAVFQALTPTGISLVDVNGDTVTTTVPVRTSLVEDVTILEAASQTPGLEATATGLPTTLEPPQNVTLRIAWTVTDCATAATMTELRAGATIEVPGRGVPPTITTFTLPIEVLVDVVRFVTTQCPT